MIEVAQWVEQMSEKHCAGGSIPSPITNFRSVSPHVKIGRIGHRYQNLKKKTKKDLTVK